MTWPQVAGNAPLILAANPKRQEGTQTHFPGFLLASFPIYSSPTGGAANIKFLDVRIVSADEYSARELEIAEGDPTIYIRRLFTHEGQPIFYHRAFLVSNPKSVNFSLAEKLTTDKNCSTGK